MPLTITIEKLYNGYKISDSIGNSEKYWYTSKKDALTKFKAIKGYRWERGIEIVDKSKETKHG